MLIAIVMAEYRLFQTFALLQINFKCGHKWRARQNKWLIEVLQLHSRTKIFEQKIL